MTMKRDSSPRSTPLLSAERGKLLRDYFLNALTLALMKEMSTSATSAATPTPQPVRPRAARTPSPA
jgi:hypothetical protein